MKSQEEKKCLAASFHGRSVTPNLEKKKSEPSTMGKQNNKKKTTCKKKEKEKEKIKKKNKIKKEKKKKKKRKRKRGGRRKTPTASHPSVKGQRPQERWIGAHWESQEANPLPNYRPFGFGPHYRLPAF